jgi:pimeloyl-ACP methyl ester carboxylesterase
MSPTFRLILLPGLGADQRLFEPQRKAFPELVVPPWIPPRKGETLPDYAVRMAETIAPLLRNHLGTGSFFGENARFLANSSAENMDLSPLPLILGGVSFGGMMAYEMARHLRPNAVVQIASCRTRQGIGNFFHAGGRLLPWVPVQAWDVTKWLSSPVTRIYSRLQPSDREKLVAMFKEMDSRFMHWVLQAILKWDPKPLEGDCPNFRVGENGTVPLGNRKRTRVFQIHGGRDPLISVRRVQPDKIIPDGGHMINVSHAEEVNAFIREAVESCNRKP